jgi:hypothetical protein
MQLQTLPSQAAVITSGQASTLHNRPGLNSNLGFKASSHLHAAAWALVCAIKASQQPSHTCNVPAVAMTAAYLT